MNTQAMEDRFLESLVAMLPSSPRRLNQLLESDAELLRLPGGDTVLAVTTDSIVEEIELGLYEDPYLIGWMTVMVNVSDLAAVGARPLGILLDQTFRPDTAARVLERTQSGVRDACRAAGIHVLGGDLNFSSLPKFGGTALGLISDGPILTRRGCRPGDLLYSSGRVGQGAAFALTSLRPGPVCSFRPPPRLAEGELVRRFGSCVMDTSDGLLPALDQLCRLNPVGFDLEQPLDQILHSAPRGLARANAIAPWMMLAGPHGDFELVFTLPRRRVESFGREARAMGWDPIQLGRVSDAPGVRLQEDGHSWEVDTTTIRDLAARAGADLDAYLEGLTRIGESGKRPLPVEAAS